MDEMSMDEMSMDEMSMAILSMDEIAMDEMSLSLSLEHSVIMLSCYHDNHDNMITKRKITSLGNQGLRKIHVHGRNVHGRNVHGRMSLTRFVHDA